MMTRTGRVEVKSHKIVGIVSKRFRGKVMPHIVISYLLACGHRTERYEWMFSREAGWAEGEIARGEEKPEHRSFKLKCECCSKGVA